VATVLAVTALVSACGGSAPTPLPSVAPTPRITPDPHLADPATADEVFLALGAAGLRLTANNAQGGEKGSPLVKRINATYLGWPLSVSQYKSSSALTKLTDWPADEKPGQGEAPVAIAGLNILIEWGPTTGAKPKRPVGRQLQGLRDLASSLHVLLSPIRSRAIVRVPGAVESSAVTDASAEPEAAPDD
jgi:hypothetical protein